MILISYFINERQLSHPRWFYKSFWVAPEIEHNELSYAIQILF